MLESIQNQSYNYIANATFIDASTINPGTIAANAIVTTLPFLFIYLLIYRSQIREILSFNNKLKALYKRTGNAIILLSGDIEDKKMDKFEIAINKARDMGAKDIILILDTFGGWVFAAERIANAIKNYPGKVHAYIPRYAMSGGSYIAFSCHDIHMAKTSSLGPIDPQIGVLFWVHSAKAWRTVLKFKGKKANDESVAMAVYAEQYTKLIKDKLDTFPMLTGKNKFTDFLTSGNIPHGFQINESMLSKYGIKPLEIDFAEVFKIVKKSNQGVKFYYKRRK